ncbi:MAG: hypothetical protein HY618_06250 [Candidatus Tectomicrobia bacterium]|uniref:Uncharacterized protein n=1 Tax=Tectimicrobiota bacterium TaxID=2528274 RepID=A0A932ZV19_UNCTE|nr:hypothetical protein [Candidatus Tectomicrobia bacterium]
MGNPSEPTQNNKKIKKGPNVTPIEKARLKSYFEEGVFNKEKERISRFGNPLQEPLIIEFDPEDAAEGHYTLITSGVTLGVSGTVSIATADAQIKALEEKGIKFRRFRTPDE